MIDAVEHIEGHTFHGRKGAVKNAFRYSVDYVLLEPERDIKSPSLFSRNRRNVFSVWDADHGGEPGQGAGVAWLREVIDARGYPAPARILLLTQPRVMNHVFNPVSFWLCLNTRDELTMVMAEVTNTFGQRHSYLCRKPDGSVIDASDRLTAEKIFYVSPFQPVEGGYVFRFDFQAERVGIWIDYSQGHGGLIATLTGPRAPLSNTSILRSVLRRPFGSRRVLGLIHWQALRLWFKRAKYQTRPEPPNTPVSSG